MFPSLMDGTGLPASRGRIVGRQEGAESVDFVSYNLLVEDNEQRRLH